MNEFKWATKNHEWASAKCFVSMMILIHKKIEWKEQKKNRKPVFRLFRRNDRTTHDKTNYKHNKFNFIHKMLKKKNFMNINNEQKRFFVVQYLARSRRVCFSYFVFIFFYCVRVCLIWKQWMNENKNWKLLFFCISTWCAISSVSSHRTQPTSASANASNKLRRLDF